MCACVILMCCTCKHVLECCSPIHRGVKLIRYPRGLQRHSIASRSILVFTWAVFPGAARLINQGKSQPDRTHTHTNRDTDTHTCTHTQTHMYTHKKVHTYTHIYKPFPVYPGATRLINQGKSQPDRTHTKTGTQTHGHTDKKVHMYTIHTCLTYAHIYKPVSVFSEAINWIN